MERGDMAGSDKANNRKIGTFAHQSYSSFNLLLKKVGSVPFMFKRLVLVIALSVPVTSVLPTSTIHAADPIPEYTELLPNCTVAAVGVPCYIPGQVSDSPVSVFTECTVAITNYCYVATVDGAPVPSTLRFVVRLTSWKTHDATVENAQYGFNINAFYVPPSRTFERTSYFDWGMKPQNQSPTGGLVDLSAILSKTSKIKVEIRYKTSKMPQYNVLVADQGKMNFTLSGQDLVTVIDGYPAQVALESDAQHINFDTEKNEDTTLPWTDRCGFPSMKFVVCNVNIADSAPLVFYARSSTFVNSPGADVPGPIWVSTNATYFHFPSVLFDGAGNKQLQVKTAAPHLLPDGKTLNTGSFTAFLPNKLLEQWKIDKTESSLNNALATSIKKADAETVVERSFVISEEGVTIVFPTIGYSSPVVNVTAVSGTVSQSANQVYAQLLAGAKVGGSVTTTPATIAPTTIAPTTTETSTNMSANAAGGTASLSSVKTVKKGSSTLLLRLIKTVGKGFPSWKKTGLCKIGAGRLIAPKKATTCTLTLTQAKYKTTPKRTLKITVKVS